MMKKKIPNFLIITFFFLISLLFTKLSIADNEVTISMSSEPGTLDWNLATDSSSFLIINNIMKGLTKLNKDLKVENNLADEWYFTDESKIIFKLKKGILWSDNKELKAHHFKDSWERLLNPKTAADYAYFLFDIKNAKEYNSGKIKNFEEVGIKIINDYIIEIDLIEKKTYFPSLMSFMSTFPIRKDLISIYKESWVRKENLVTLGEFRLIDRKNNSYLLFKNKKNKIVKIIINENSSSSLAMFESGQIDILDGGGIPLLEIPYLKEKKILKTVSQFRNNYIGFNVNKFPFNDPDIRRAFLYSIDKSVIEKILQKTVKKTSSWIPEGMLGNRVYINEFNSEKAKKILKDKKFYQKIKDKKIKFLFPESANNRLIAEVLQDMWKTNIGVDIKVEGLEWKVYLSKLDTDRPNMFRAGWSADYADPHNFMNLFTCNSGNNETGWCNKSFDNIVRKASSELDLKIRDRLYKQAQKILLDKDIVIIPLYESDQIYLQSDKIKSVNYSKLGVLNFSQIKIKN